MKNQTESNNLTQKTLSSMIWKFAERIGAQLVTTVVSIILARILMPEDYGLIAIVNVLIALCNVFVSSGFGSALIQKKDADETDFSSVFYASFVISLALYAILFFASPLIADFYDAYDKELLTAVLRVMGLRLPIASFNSVQQAYVSRQMAFRNFFIATLIGTVISAVVGISMAYAGCGVWALVGQYLTNVVVNTFTMLVVVRWRPKLLFSWKKLKALLSFGWKLLVSGLMDTGYQELRSLVIGKMYTPADLAYYDQGKKYPSVIATNINSSFNAVLLPAMSKVQDDKSKVKEATRKSIRISSYLLIPCMMGLACVAEPFVRVFLTDKWLPMVPFLQMMCFVYAFYPIHTANLTAIMAVGRSDIHLILEIIKKAVGIISLLISMWFGVFWIAFTSVLTTLISCFINAFPNKKLLNYGYGEQMMDLLPAIGLSLLMGIPVYLMNFLPLAPILLLVLQVVVGVAIYVIASIITKAYGFTFILGYIKKLFQKKNKSNSKSFENSISTEAIENFLKKVDFEFPVPLSQKTDLEAYAKKLKESATCCCKFDNGEIVSMVAGYTNNLTDNIAYISLVATLPEYRGKGFAEELVKEFILNCKEKKIIAVHLYTLDENEKAVNLYKKIGFEKYILENESRKSDLHLIYFLEENK